MAKTMRITVCELPHDPNALAKAWGNLCRHTAQHASDLVLLPEFAFVEPVWETDAVDPARWTATEALSEAWLARLPELHVTHVVGARPVTLGGRRFNQGFIWSSAAGEVPLRSNFFTP